jgi:hypothetical protein
VRRLRAAINLIIVGTGLGPVRRRSPIRLPIGSNQSERVRDPLLQGACCRSASQLDLVDADVLIDGVYAGCNRRRQLGREQLPAIDALHPAEDAVA